MKKEESDSKLLSFDKTNHAVCDEGVTHRHKVSACFSLPQFHELSSRQISNISRPKQEVRNLSSVEVKNHGDIQRRMT